LDIVTGLTAVTQALGIARELREIDRGVDEAAFKLKLADLQENLADAKVALSDAKIALSTAAERAAALEIELDIARNGDFCPKCLTGRMRLTCTEAHHMHGLINFGVEDWQFACANEECGFEQTRIHDPHGAVSAQAKKK
jgi:hypothetical protein